LHAVPEAVSDEVATFVEPLAAAMHSFDENILFPGARAAVIGDGKLGLLIAMAMARQSKILGQAVLIGKHAEKLSLVNTLGIDTCLLDDFGERDFDVVVEASGQASGLAMALSIAKPKGKIILKSTYAKAKEGNSLDIDLSPVVINELSVIGSRCGDFTCALAALAEESVDPSILISDRYDLSNGEAAFAKAGQRGSLKVLLDTRA
jgi:threonine dehydrogenase-like Zn-dependent dehydrogenase